MLYFLREDFWKNPWLVIFFMASVLLIVFVRYFAFALLYQAILKITGKTGQNIFTTRRSQIRREIWWSFLSSVVFTIFAALCLWAWQNGWTKIYSDPRAYPLWYLMASGILVLLLYETYYYWLHRLMHLPQLFRWVHKVHHESIHPTVFTSFCFHPFEAVLQFLFFPLVIVLIPLHYAVMGIVLILFTISALINHSGTEIFKNRFALKHLIGSSHHDVHHKEFRTNYGLYFTWWDKWMKTESKASTIEPRHPTPGEHTTFLRSNAQGSFDHKL